MRYEFSSEKINELRTDTLICFTTEITSLGDKLLKDLDKASVGALLRMVSSGEFSGKNGQTADLGRLDGFAAGRVLLVGIGNGKKVDADRFRCALGTLSRARQIVYSDSAAVSFGKFADKDFYQAAVEGYLLGAYRLLQYKTGEEAKDKRRLSKLVLVADRKDQIKAMKQAVERGTIIAEGQLLVRDLAQTPGCDLTPKVYAKKIQDLARKNGFTCQVLDERAIAKEKMGGLMGVARGSAEPPRFMIMQYNGGRQGQQPVVLVGKGVTFDSGGISLKPADKMHEMKQDMAGSAAVVASMVTASRLKLPINIVGLVPATENLPSGTATKPGDILFSRKGKTIEIINTDAEGRLILADALDYANEFKPQAVIDIATLTGASLYILGYAGAPILGNDEELLNRINDAADATGERVWPLPIWDEHRDQMKGTIADLVNSGGRPAGTIAAAAFLENFIGDWPWAHIDIAYVDLEPKGKPYIPAGPTGFGLRLLIEVLSSWKKL